MREENKIKVWETRELIIINYYLMVMWIKRNVNEGETKYEWKNKCESKRNYRNANEREMWQNRNVMKKICERNRN